MRNKKFNVLLLFEFRSSSPRRLTKVVSPRRAAKYVHTTHHHHPVEFSACSILTTGCRTLAVALRGNSKSSIHFIRLNTVDRTRTTRAFPLHFPYISDERIRCVCDFIVIILLRDYYNNNNRNR